METMSQILEQEKQNLSEVEFLSPEQRLEVVANILADIALRLVKQSHEESQD